MPVLGSGTFQTQSYDLFSTSGAHTTWTPGGSLPALAGAWTAVGTDGSGPISGGWVISPAAGRAILVLSGYLAGSYFFGSEPPGFTPTTSLQASSLAGGSINSGDTVTVDVGGFHQTFNGPASSYGAIPITDNTSWALLKTALKQVTYNVTFPNGINNAGNEVELSGNFSIIEYWWVLPDTDACGNPQTGQLQLSPSDTTPPGPGYQLLDPASPLAAQPTVVVNTIEPAEGPTAGGTAVTIKGSGFGIGATVTFDGVTATSIVVVSQYEITCDSPAHAIGTGNVVVTNLDGTHN